MLTIVDSNDRHKYLLLTPLKGTQKVVPLERIKEVPLFGLNLQISTHAIRKVVDTFVGLGTLMTSDL